MCSGSSHEWSVGRGSVLHLVKQTPIWRGSVLQLVTQMVSWEGECAPSGRADAHMEGQCAPARHANGQLGGGLSPDVSFRDAGDSEGSGVRSSVHRLRFRRVLRRSFSLDLLRRAPFCPFLAVSLAAGHCSTAGAPRTVQLLGSPRPPLSKEGVRLTLTAFLGSGWSV